jgi:hypothetical protein
MSISAVFEEADSCLWGDFLRKGRNKKNDEKSKYYSNKSFDL